jgi:membrane fusion protein (multidrug efflux system)
MINTKIKRIYRMKPLLPLSIVLGVFVLLLAACNKPATPQMGQMPTPEVTVIRVTTQNVPISRELVGRLASTRIAQVRARVAGIILKRVYTEGTDVNKGQVLFQIDPAPLEAELHAEEAALARAKADAANASLISTRYKDLDKKGLISSQDLDTALANERTTLAAVKQAQANVETARLNLGYATVTAPIDGRAGRALVTEGALVGQGEATELTTVEQIDPIYVNFSQSVAELQQLQGVGPMAEGMGEQKTRVEVLLPDNSVYPHEGKLDFSNLAVDPGTGTVSLRAVVPNPNRRLLPGMFVNLRLTVGQLDNAFLLPQAAVGRDNQGAYVLAVNSEGKVEQRRVNTHGLTRENWIVTGDINNNDQIILEGLQKVRPGGMVKAVLKGGSDTSNAGQTQKSAEAKK